MTATSNSIQEYTVDSTKRAAEEAFRYAKAVPADKLDWSPLDTGRSVLNLCRELAMCPTWTVDIINGVEMKWDEETQAKIRAEQSQWKTVEDCENEFKNRFAKLAEMIMGTPDEKLANTRWLPFDGGRDFTVLEMMEYPRWNFNYHLGQIGYIQTLYGDKDMH